MLQQPEVRLYDFGFAQIVFDFFEHPSLDRRPQDPMIRKMHPAEEVDAGRGRFEKCLVRVEREREFLFEKLAHFGENIQKDALVLRHDHKIVSISDIIFLLQLVLHELIELVHVYIDEELAREIAERQAFARAGTFKTLHHPLDKPDRLGIGDVFLHNLDEDCLIDTCEELFDVAFQHPAGASIVSRNFSRELLKTIKCSVRSLPDSARV